VTFKKHVIEKIAIASFLFALAIGASLGPGLQIDKMENCKSFEIEFTLNNHARPDMCLSVFDL